MTRWIKREIDPARVRELAQRYQIDPLTASILVRRNITEPEEVRYFLEDDLQLLHNPFLFTAMEDAVDRILMARDEEEKVLVFGDSDADGVTATILLTEALRDFGLDAAYRVPEGEEPYGLSLPAVDAAAAEGRTLIITVDCGISNHREVAAAREKGIDVIIADHHHLQAEEMPPALAVLDPKLQDSGYPFRDLSGCGVALKLAHALAIARLGMFKEPVALLYAGSRSDSETANSSEGSQVIEVLRLDHLLEKGRLILESDSEGRFPADTLDKLERFVRGRIILTWNRTETLRFFRTHFGAAAEIDAADLSSMAVELWPSMAGRGFHALHRSSRLRKYAQNQWTHVDTLKSLFNATVMHRIIQQGMLTDRMFQLAALGTVADLMPLKGENRIIVRRGMEGINTTPSRGIRELKLTLNLAKPLSATDLAWQITPAINAAGRLGTPGLALDLLSAASMEEALSAASRLVEANAERRRLGTEAWEHIREALNQSLEHSEGRYAIIATAQIRPGITGLLASRAANMMKVPVIVAALREDGTCTGSIRAGSSFPLTRLLAYCADLFMDYGGHDSAAGFTLKTEQWDNLVCRIIEFMSQVPPDTSEPEFFIDAELPHQYVTPDLIPLCKRFEPFGEENAPLIFCSRQVPMVDAQIVGRNGKNHLKLTLDFGTYKWPALLWDGAERLERDFSFRNGDRVDILYKVTLNYWNGEEKPQLELYDIRRSGLDKLYMDSRTARDT